MNALDRRAESTCPSQANDRQRRDYLMKDVMKTRMKLSADELVFAIIVGLVSLVFVSPFVLILIAYGYGFESLS